MGAIPLGPPPPLLNLACVAGTKKRRGRGKAQKGKWRGPLPSFPNTLPLYPQSYPQQVVIVIGLLTTKKCKSRHIERLPFVGMAGQLEYFCFLNLAR